MRCPREWKGWLQLAMRQLWEAFYSRKGRLEIDSQGWFQNCLAIRRLLISYSLSFAETEKKVEEYFQPFQLGMKSDCGSGQGAIARKVVDIFIRMGESTVIVWVDSLIRIWTDEWCRRHRTWRNRARPAIFFMKLSSRTANKEYAFHWS